MISLISIFPVMDCLCLVSDNIASGMRPFYLNGVLLFTSTILMFKQDAT